MQVNDTAAWRRQQLQDREPKWALHEANGVVSASCRACGWPLLITWSKGSSEADLRALDEHQRTEHHQHDAPPTRGLGAFGQSIENSLMNELLRKVGGLCRCTPCCCKSGQGHNHPAWAYYEAEQRAWDRYKDALESGLSDFEAREEGWPSQCRPDIDWHTTPHVGCILR